MTRDDLPPPDPADPKIPVTPAGPVVPDGPLIPDGPAVPDGPAGCSVTAWLLQGTLLRKALLFYLAGLLAFGAYNYFKHPSLEKLVVGSDMEGYYQYLPWFFLHDWQDFKQLPWAKPYGEGTTLSVFTCGTALLQAPFFLVAHGLTLVADEKANGYGRFYFFSVFLAGLFYATLGMVFLGRGLRRWFDDKTSLMTVLLIFYGTNLFYYTIMMPGMSHVYSFAMVAALIPAIPRFYEKPGVGSALGVALPLSVAILIRPTTAIIALFVLLFEVTSRDQLHVRARFLLRNYRLLLMMGGVAVLMWLPQMVYWHFVTGKWIVWSYQSEGFPFWKNPRLLTVLFGKRGGWFTYTPLMLAATGTLFYMAWRRILTAPAVLVTMLLILYAVSSWWAPTFSASAGYRALIEFLPLMAIPLAFLVSHIRNLSHGAWKTSLLWIAVLLVLYNIQFAFKYDATVWWDWPWSYKTMLRLLTF
ncbi:MAG: hypothetical protein GXY59_02090 [Bacteroidales bacterium]|nr:hypothetical protein [Bacteroidales bacterium]